MNNPQILKKSFVFYDVEINLNGTGSWIRRLG